MSVGSSCFWLRSGFMCDYLIRRTLWGRRIYRLGGIYRSGVGNVSRNRQDSVWVMSRNLDIDARPGRSGVYEPAGGSPSPSGEEKVPEVTQGRVGSSPSEVARW